MASEQKSQINQCNYRIGEALRPGPPVMSAQEVAEWNASQIRSGLDVSDKDDCGKPLQLPCPHPSICKKHRRELAHRAQKRAEMFNTEEQVEEDNEKPTKVDFGAKQQAPTLGDVWIVLHNVTI